MLFPRWMRNLPAPLASGNQPAGVKRDSSGRVIGGKFTAQLENLPPWTRLLTLEPIGVVRGVQLARLSFYPVIQQGEHTSSDFFPGGGCKFRACSPSDIPTGNTIDPMQDLVRSAVVNPEQLQTAAVDPLSTTHLV